MNPIDKLLQTYNFLKNDIKAATWTKRCKIVTVLILWIASVIFGLVAGLEAVELYDLATTTGFLPSVIENGLVSVGLYYLHSLIPD